MITSADCLRRYGDPVKENNMMLWDVPEKLETGILPNRIYCNKDLIPILTVAFFHVINRGLLGELKTWDGCFNIRKKVGALSQSLHSWGIAIDINAAWNGYGRKPTMSKELVQCFTDAGMVWGGNWAKPDGMHFELREFPK
jgi:hypothetical protein